MLDRSRNDLRFAVRLLRKSPVFTIVAVLAISLGSGAVTTIFSAMNALVLRPLPGTTNGDRLVGVELIKANGRMEMAGTYTLYTHLRDGAHTVSALGAWTKATFSIAAKGDGSLVTGNFASANYFSVLGLRPALGRFFLADEDRTPLAHPVLVVSYVFWTSKLGSDSGLVGRTVSVNGNPYTLIGVAPQGFRGTITLTPIDAWVPLMMQGQLNPERDIATNQSLRILGRLKDGSDVAVAQAELSTLAAAASADQATPAAANRIAGVRLSPLRSIPEDARGMFLAFMALLLGAAGLVLLIASVNVASMLSARAIARRREMALRAALGASRGRLVSQLLTEILVLFALGAIGGVTFAFLATRAATFVSIPTDVVVAPDMSPDLRVMAFALGVSLLTGIVFGLAPALRTARDDISARLRDGSAGSGSRRTIAGNVLIVGQLALSLVLLVAAGLFLRALTIGARVDPGFDRMGVSIAQLDTRTWGYTDDRGRQFYHDLRDRVAAIPGVSNVSFASFAPLTTRSMNDSIGIGDSGMFVWLVNVGSDYFSTLRIPVVAGRALARTDDDRAPRVAVINETLAKRLAPNGNALGRTFTRHGQLVTVVGVARDARYADLAETTPPLVYYSNEQFWESRQTLLVRITGNPAQVASGIQAALRSLDPMLPRPGVTTLENATGITLLPQRIAAIVTGVLGGVGLLLATLGLYGVIAYSVNQRTREMGIRVALGARPFDVLGLVFREGIRLAVAGVAIGLVLAAAATRLIAGFLFDVSSLDAITFVGMSTLFIAVASVAIALPARRAAGSDPMTALRSE
jgi:predicted permease